MLFAPNKLAMTSSAVVIIMTAAAAAVLCCLQSCVYVCVVVYLPPRRLASLTLLLTNPHPMLQTPSPSSLDMADWPCTLKSRGTTHNICVVMTIVYKALTNYASKE